MAYLILENGSVFQGQAFGHDAEAVGELVFSTAMTGYMKTLCDPAYYGQIVLQTFPLIGNYGVVPAECSYGNVSVSAYIVREWCQEPSNFRSEGELDTFLHQNKIPGIYGVDTRALTRILRDNGVMNVMISRDGSVTEERLCKLRAYKPTGGVAALSTNNIYRLEHDNAKYNVVVWDFGAARETADTLLDYGCQVTVVPHTITSDELLALNPDGLLISDGPGDPSDNQNAQITLQTLRERKLPTAGLGLGHQLLALSRGAVTKKLQFGHRGANHAVSSKNSNRVFVTNQNHGFIVKADTIRDVAEISLTNLSDGTCEGLEYKNEPAFSVQYRPSKSDPYDFYGKFIGIMRGDY